jgi:capsular polysaccharide biosynthesis protein
VKKRDNTPPIDWFEREIPTRFGMVAELQRIARRTRVRPFRVLAVALVITAAVTYKFAMKPRVYTADIVLAMNEGAFSNERDKSIPFEQLKEYVENVLLPDNALLEIIEKRTPGRIDTFGKAFVLESFRDNVEILIWKNSFAYYDEADPYAQKSARIGIEVTDLDPDNAFEIARDLASVAIRTHDANRRLVNGQLSAELDTFRDQMALKVDEVANQLVIKENALAAARKIGNNQAAATLIVDINNLVYSRKQYESVYKAIDLSPELFADKLTDAKLDVAITVVDQVRPAKQEQSELVLAMIIAVIGTGAFLGSALLLGSFDSRVHDTDDVTRLNLPVLGHVPGFPGDHVGSLDARGAARRRVPSFLRWRSQR